MPKIKFNSSYRLNNGVNIPIFGFGTSHIPNNEDGKQMVIAAIRRGYRMIDTAQFYANQIAIGKAVRECGISRNKLFVTSKCWNLDQGYERAKVAINRSLKEMNLDYIDLYLIHWPIPKGHVNDHIKLNQETWKAFEEAYACGKIKAIGLSNFMPEHIQSLLKTAKVKPTVNQIEMHPGCLYTKVLDYCRKHDIAIQAWGPIIHGRADDDKILNQIARKYQKSPSQICLRWVIQHGAIPQPRTMSIQHLIENSKVFDFELSAKDMKIIDTQIKKNAYGGNPYCESPN